ncbi:Small Conductance Mechanosensitive Ion Channel (MscS) Family [Pseudoloma neurophilia]|uniref:Small Conductance Mechanosensitive Ion Channel (MscS) Family n=1 Tax=Pseudoloma neurophilia TaxID=146866 RepID=A0A0R0LY18_9MICR|nr:Small Conductance Mechanosensitive Ion Channel (MscS) Family [Pseudoloma neurophilia]
MVSQALKDKNEINSLLDFKIYDKIEGKDLNDSNFTILVYFLIGLLIYSVALLPLSQLIEYQDQHIILISLKVSYYILVFIASNLFAETFLKLSRSYILNIFFSNDFISFFIKKRNLEIRFIFTIVFFSIIIYVNTYFIGIDLSENAFRELIVSVSILLSVSFLCFLISEMIVDYCDFISYSLNYKERVLEGKKRLKLILKLNKILPEKITNLKTYALRLFYEMLNLTQQKKPNQVVSRSQLLTESKELAVLQNDTDDMNQEKKNIHKLARRTPTQKKEETLSDKKSNISVKKENISVNEKFKLDNTQSDYFLTPEDFFNLFHSTEMFNLFDFDKNKKVTKHEFIKRYIYLYEEREKLKRALKGNLQNMFKIQVLITSLFIPFIIFILLAMTGQLTSITESFTIAGLVVFPFSFAFKSVIEELFESVIFVFFIKPFDIGDIFFAQQQTAGKNTILDTDEANLFAEKYEVVNIGILYSDFFLNGRFITLKNTSFNKFMIFNLRKSEFITHTYKLEFNKDKFLEKEEEFIGKLDDHFSDLPTSSYKLSNYSIKNQSIRMFLETKRVIPYQEIDTIEERHDNFIIYLNELTKEIDLN